MNQKSTYHKYYLSCITLITVIIGLYLGYVTYYINYWPTDSQIPYIPVASRLFDLPSLSQMHSVMVNEMFWYTMHGKEALILGIAIVQDILNDFKSLYPNILLLIICVQVSSILVYLIIRKYFDEHIGFISYLLFSACFWPYLYVMQGAHQPLSLMNFLLSVYFLQLSDKRSGIHLLSGVFLGFTMFSSPTAILFLPYFFSLFLYQEYEENNKINSKKFINHSIVILCGASIPFLLFTLPDPVKSINDFIKFIKMSQHKNTFMIYRDFISQYFKIDENFKGAGWAWIFKYFFLIMPVLFTTYLLGIFYFVKKSFRKPSFLIIVLISITTPFAVELAKVAQFGRNYFPWIVGIFGLISCFIYFVKIDFKNKKLNFYDKSALVICAVCFLGHVVFNAYIFTTDIFPSRMATTNIYNWCIKNDIKELYVYHDHPRNLNIVKFLNNPKLKNKITFRQMSNIKQVKEGFILIPPISGKTIYNECRLGNYQGDTYLTELLISNKLSNYVVAAFKTLGSSRIWTQEEELCTYRDIILGQITNEDRKNGNALILDADKLQKEWFIQ